MKIFFPLILALAVVIASAGCLDSTQSATTSTLSAGSSGTVSVVYEKDDLDSGQDNAAEASLTLQGSSIIFNGSGISVEGTTGTITSAGTYRISGTLDDGRIIVNTEDNDTVKLVFDGVDIACSTSAPLYIVNAEKTVITLADGKDNYLSDGNSSIVENTESDEPDAVIFSRDDLTLNGSGSLTVTATNNHGIVSKDDLKIIGGHITVTAAGDGIQ